MTGRWDVWIGVDVINLPPIPQPQLTCYLLALEHVFGHRLTWSASKLLPVAVYLPELLPNTIAPIFSVVPVDAFQALRFAAISSPLLHLVN